MQGFLCCYCSNDCGCKSLLGRLFRLYYFNVYVDDRAMISFPVDRAKCIFLPAVVKGKTRFSLAARLLCHSSKLENLFLSSVTQPGYCYRARSKQLTTCITYIAAGPLCHRLPPSSLWLRNVRTLKNYNRNLIHFLSGRNCLRLIISLPTLTHHE